VNILIKRDEMAGDWRWLHDEERLNLYSLPSIIRTIKSGRMILVGNVARRETNAYRLLVEKSEGRRQLGRPRHKWVDNIKMDLKEVGWGGMDWIDLAKDRDQ
jgi:hypothetical protein